MGYIFLIGFGLVLLAVFVIFFFSLMENFLDLQIDKHKGKSISPELYDLTEQKTLLKQVRKITAIIFTTVLIGGGVYWLVKDTSMQGFVMEWLNLLIRWIHVVVGVMWIGASFYFIFLENNLNRTDGVRDELAGNLWAIHGGGFYYIEKYKIAPKQLPKTLHWFKYEAYFTWLSGFTLLIVVYYMDAHAFLIDKTVADISVATAIATGIGTLVIGWIIYNQLCKSWIVKHKMLFGLIGFVLLIGFSFFLTQVFSARAAFIHVGALMGTLMAGNVYFGIIPAQKALVKAAVTGQPLDASLGKKAGERSLHNNYLTLPVIFIMISNHFPSTFGHEYNWIVLMVITLASAGIKHYWNLLEQGIRTQYILPVSIIALLSLAMVTSPLFEKVDENASKASFAEVNNIIQLRCIQCHSATPTDSQWKKAPNGVMLDTSEQIVALSDKIMIRAVRTNSMPQGNKTNMTEEEREVIKNWILQGATLD